MQRSGIAILILGLIVSGCSTLEDRTKVAMGAVEVIEQCQAEHIQPGDAFLCLAYTPDVEHPKPIPACVWNHDCKQGEDR
jgi:hypothetical protein